MLGFTAAFFAGRVVSYSIHALTAENIREPSIGEAFQRSLTSPFGIALQLAMFALLVAASQVDWEKHPGSGGA